jgi:hypothetical protein
VSDHEIRLALVRDVDEGTGRTQLHLAVTGQRRRPLAGEDDE